LRLFRVDLLYFSIAPAGLTHSTISILLYVFLSYYQMESESKLQVPASSNEAVSYKMREGVQTMVTQAGIGLLVGGMTGIVLSRHEKCWRDLEQVSEVDLPGPSAPCRLMNFYHPPNNSQQQTNKQTTICIGQQRTNQLACSGKMITIHSYDDTITIKLFLGRIGF
jgi:hypothetical protein